MAILADQELLRRFAEWLFSKAPSHATEKLLRAVQMRSPVIGKHVQRAWDNSDRRDDLAKELRQDFSLSEVEWIFTLVGANPADVTWSTSASRQRHRQDSLDALAQTLGFETWRRLETAALNGEIVLRTEPPYSTSGTGRS